MSENVIKDDQNITLIFQREQEVKCLFFKSEHRAKVLYDSKDKCCNKLVKEYPLISAIVEGSTIESDNLWFGWSCTNINCHLKCPSAVLPFIYSGCM